MRNIMVQPFPLGCNYTETDVRRASSRKSSRNRSRSPIESGMASLQQSTKMQLDITKIQPIKEHLSYGSLPGRGDLRMKKQSLAATAKMRNQLTQYNTSRFLGSQKPPVKIRYQSIKSRRRRSRNNEGKYPIINASQNYPNHEENIPPCTEITPTTNEFPITPQLPSVDAFSPAEE